MDFLTPRRKARIYEALRKKQPDLRVFLDDVHSSQNLSAILRSCDAVGVLRLDYARITDEAVEIYDTITQGSHRWVAHNRIAYRQRVAFLNDLKTQGYQIVVTHLQTRSIPFRQIDFTKPTVIVMGNEKEGVSKEVLGVCDHSIIIPMFGMAQSLNVSVATAIILFEAQRQRQEAGMYDEPQLSSEAIEKIAASWIYRDGIARKSKGARPYSKKEWLEW